MSRIQSVCLAFTVLLIVPSDTFAASRTKPRHRIIFNDDAQVLTEAPEKNTSAFVKAWLDREADAVPFSTFVFLAATPDICTYDTRAGELYSARFGENFNKGWTPGIRGLRSEGTDALRLVTAHMKAKGKQVLAAIRLSDTHHRALDPGDPLCPKFALDHPEYVIKQPDGRTNETALDYSYAEVRAHRLAIMREIVDQYDVDGLELNFVRWAKHFPRDKGREKAPIMTAYLGQIREMLDVAAKKRGRKSLTLGVRVPESIHTCWLAGVDIATWVKKGWVDYVVVATWNNTDPQVPIEEFTRLTKPAGVDTVVLMGNMIGAIWAGPPTVLDRGIAMSAKHARGYQGMLITASEARAAAANYYSHGADGISFWNVGIHFGRAKTAAAEQRERIRRWTHAVLCPETVSAGPRRYHYLPMGKGIGSRKPPLRSYPWYDEGRSPLGQPNSPVLQFTSEGLGKRLVFPFRMADGRNGERLKGTIRFWIYQITEQDRIEIDINGKPIDPAKIKLSPAGKRRGALPGLQFEVALSDCPPFQGDNHLGLRLKTKADRKATPYMEELVVIVKSSIDGQSLNDKGSALRKPFRLIGIGQPPKTSRDARLLDKTVVAFSGVVDLGKDIGQNFGSLFEARDSQGRVVAGAGFIEVYNTRFRGQRHTLQFFVRPQEDADQFTTQRLPHPDLDCGVYLFDFDEKLYAWSSVRNSSVRLWDEAFKRWKDVRPPQTGSLRSGDGIVRLGSGTLVFTGNQAIYFTGHELSRGDRQAAGLSPPGQGRTVLTAPDVGTYYSFYYAGGHLFFYHTHRAEAGGFTKIYACPWTPQTKNSIDLSQAVVMQTKYVGETPFAWGQFQGTVLTVSNQGGVHAFDGSTWKTLQEADNTVSFQVYSMLNYHDRLLLAQYPTGNLFEYKGKELKRLEGWPPRLPGVSSSAREAQTLTIYRGDLMVGVWPWAELWRYDRDADCWHSMGRMFTHPKVTDKTTHPYEAEAKKYSLVTNHWGQRITGMVPLGDSLMLSTSSKGTYQWFDKYDFLTEQQRREYGAVLRLQMPGNLAAQIEWKDQPTRLEFIVERNRMLIRQDGKELASCRVEMSNLAVLKRAKVHWGQGVFGRLNGKLLNTSARSR